MFERIRLEVLGLTYSQVQSGAYALILGEIDSTRRIPIIIGQYEAQAIAMQLQGLEAPRPLTHDLLNTIMKEFQINLREVFIYKLEKEVFYCELLCWHEGDIIKKIDARTSDAIALALRADCPIYIAKDIFDRSSITFNPDADENENQELQTVEKNETSLQNLPVQELEKILQDAIDVENYELASKIRDEINKRSQD